MSARTVEANYLSEKDKKILELCTKITDEIKSQLSSEEEKNHYLDKWGKISKTRDAGTGRGGGKLNRDALCTRGKVDQSLQANRNLRWTPIVFSKINDYSFKIIEEIKVNSHQVIEYKIEGSFISGQTLYDLTEPYILLPDVFENIRNDIPESNQASFWNKNKLPIPQMEWCPWTIAVETFASLSIIIATAVYGLNKKDLYSKISNILSSQNVDSLINFPTENFINLDDLSENCPICKLPLINGLVSFRSEEREEIFGASFSLNKRGEGEDSALQLVHIKPLKSSEVNHNSKNVRFGHRWCNIAQSDHSLEDAVRFFRHISTTHY